MADDGWNFDDYIAELEQVEKRSQNPQPIFRSKVHQQAIQKTREVFETQGGSGKSGKWAPYSPRSRITMRLLHQRGDLEASYLNPQHPYHYYRDSGSHVEVGSTHPLAAYHERGVPSRRLPARSVKIRDSALDRMIETIAQWVFGIFRG